MVSVDVKHHVYYNRSLGAPQRRAIPTSPLGASGKAVTNLVRPPLALLYLPWPRQRLIRL